MDFASARERLVDGLVSRGLIERDSTADALRTVPRHEFVPEEHRDQAYVDQPLPIGAGQTISAPHMVAIMTDLLGLDPGDHVLEIGTGCGYHAAVTAEVVGAKADEARRGRNESADEAAPTGRVDSVEYHEELADEARGRFDRLGYDVAVRVGDGNDGWPEHAPYDAAYLTCAPEQLPRAVVEQVRPGGVVVGPVGSGRQRLVRLRRFADGSVEREDHGGVRFVPMQRE